ncbi:MAG: exodeoxyribonuclease III [Rhodobacterales bacterium]|nr:exodeoxyribonuclease III [Rhodobacterales bacterium]
MYLPPKVTRRAFERLSEINAANEGKALRIAVEGGGCSGFQYEIVGYNVAVNGQKSFNGVAIISKLPLEDVVTELPGDSTDDQARWLEATIVGDHAIRMCNLYLPNGNPTPGPKYDYKLNWMHRLYQRAKDLIDSEAPAFMAGDFNIIPQPEDAANIDNWEKDALFLPESRAEFRKIINLGFTDAFRAKNFGSGNYSFWDYQAGAWNRNDGIRIDHILLCPYAADLLQDVGIDREIRAREKPSDHVPVWVKLAA